MQQMKFDLIEINDCVGLDVCFISYLFILMGNTQCCEAENKEYQHTFPHNEEETKIKAVKVQTKQQSPQEISQSPHITHTHHTPQEEPEIKIQIVVEQQPIKLPKVNQEVQARLQQKNELNQQIEAFKTSKEFGKQVYLGQLDKEKCIPQGRGKIYKRDGSVYLGQWNKGKAHGKGVYIKNDGSFYQGEFQMNNAHGKGKFVSNLLIYEGSFHNNKFQGDGVQKGKNYSFEGQYKSGYKVKGLLIWKAGADQYEYKGQFNSKNQFHGKGVLKEPTGVYDGQLQNGEKHGNGEYKFQNGLRYVGEYNVGKKCGQGTIYNCNNTIAYQGDFDDDLPHGEGIIYDQKGIKNKRKWVRGIDTEGL